MDINFGQKVGQRIKELREQNGISQERVARALGMHRVALSQVENGERKLSAEELSGIAKFFHIGTDAFLNPGAEVKVAFEKKIRVERQEIRISVPQKKLGKFKEVLLYILNKVGSRPNVGETVLYKLLYFIDFDFYEKYEEQLIGATYLRLPHGPAPVEFAEIVKDMEANKELEKINSKFFQYPQKKYLPLREPDLQRLSAREADFIDEVLARLSHMKAVEISDYSHRDVPWMTTEDGEIIDYESVFYRTPPYSVRSYSEEVQ
ncbi:MAG: DUF4065 domain-containing protein [Candidatus Omnitrophica bacterium]|nr:DUF4065 domain-containing protein [Candidatus Omnitrophota bacterium]